MPNEPLDSESHDQHLAKIGSLLEEILSEIKGLRSDVQNLPREIRD
jgi:hypothetical protein